MTKEERSIEQVRKAQESMMIKQQKSSVRENALRQAVMVNGGKGTVDDVLKGAEKLYQWLIKDLK